MQITQTSPTQKLIKDVIQGEKIALILKEVLIPFWHTSAKPENVPTAKAPKVAFGVARIGLFLTLLTTLFSVLDFFLEARTAPMISEAPESLPGRLSNDSTDFLSFESKDRFSPLESSDADPYSKKV